MKAIAALLLTLAGIAFAVSATAQPVPSTAPLAVRANVTPESGTAQWKLRGERDGTCLSPEVDTRIGVLPYLHGVFCEEATPLTVTFTGGGHARFQVNGTNMCATIARGVLFGAPRIDLHPCDQALDQLFLVSQQGGGMFQLKSLSGQCWTERGGIGYDVAVEGCRYLGDKPEINQQFRVFAPPAPSAPVQPAQIAPVAPRVDPALERVAPGPFVPIRPANLPENAPAPAQYWMVPMGADGDCFRAIATGSFWAPRIGGRGCDSVTESYVRIEYDAGGFRLSFADPHQCFTTIGKPWITLAACGDVDSQLFRIERAGADEYYSIKTPAGLCLTARGSGHYEPAQNNSALFPEPCRGEREQIFRLTAKGE
jgi:hypothetical protein